MADDLIYCPSCNGKLQLPSELYGQTVECPQCQNRFVAPMPQASAPPVLRPPAPFPGEVRDGYRRYVEDPQALYVAQASVRPPAVMLLIVSLVAGLVNGLGLLASAQIQADPREYEATIQREIAKHPEWTPEQKAQAEQMMALDTVTRFLNWDCGCSLFLNLLTFVGAWQMLRLRGYGLAVLGSILAMNPFNVPCCLLEAPFGLWALIVLMGNDVRRGFQ